MASAGQAQAHNSQPTHFSSPSACRLSWCRPWKRGCVGTLTSGYSSVTTRVNMVVNVTPKPAILSRIRAERWSSPASRSVRSARSATAHLLAVVAGVAGPGTRCVARTHGHRLPGVAGRAVETRPRRARRAHELLPGQRRHRVSTGEGVECLGGHLVPAGLERGLAALVGLVGHEQADD